MSGKSMEDRISARLKLVEADMLEDSPAKVTLTLNNGRKIERSKYYPKP